MHSGQADTLATVLIVSTLLVLSLSAYSFFQSLQSQAQTSSTQSTQQIQQLPPNIESAYTQPPSPTKKTTTLCSIIRNPNEENILLQNITLYLYRDNILILTETNIYNDCNNIISPGGTCKVCADVIIPSEGTYTYKFVYGSSPIASQTLKVPKEHVSLYPDLVIQSISAYQNHYDSKTLLFGDYNSFELKITVCNDGRDDTNTTGTLTISSTNATFSPSTLVIPELNVNQCISLTTTGSTTSPANVTVTASISYPQTELSTKNNQKSVTFVNSYYDECDSCESCTVALADAAVQAANNDVNAIVLLVSDLALTTSSSVCISATGLDPGNGVLLFDGNGHTISLVASAENSVAYNISLSAGSATLEHLSITLGAPGTEGVTVVGDVAVRRVQIYLDENAQDATAVSLQDGASIHDANILMLSQNSTGVVSMQSYVYDTNISAFADGATGILLKGYYSSDINRVSIWLRGDYSNGIYYSSGWHTYHPTVSSTSIVVEGNSSHGVYFLRASSPFFSDVNILVSGHESSGIYIRLAGWVMAQDVNVYTVHSDSSSIVLAWSSYFLTAENVYCGARRAVAVLPTNAPEVFEDFDPNAYCVVSLYGLDSMSIDFNGATVVSNSSYLIGYGLSDVVLRGLNVTTRGPHTTPVSVVWSERTLVEDMNLFADSDAPAINLSKSSDCNVQNVRAIGREGRGFSAYSADSYLFSNVLFASEFGDYAFRIAAPYDVQFDASTEIRICAASSQAFNTGDGLSCVNCPSDTNSFIWFGSETSLPFECNCAEKAVDYNACIGS